MVSTNTLIFVGLPGVGKSTVSRVIGKILHYRVIDLDRYITKKYKESISSIFETKGEETFRKYETESLEEIFKKYNKLVLSVGGGAFCYNENSNLCLNSGKVIWLNAPLDLIISRLNNCRKVRPLLLNKNINETLENLLNTRKSFYEKANHTINIEENETPEDIANKIINII